MLYKKQLTAFNMILKKKLGIKQQVIKEEDEIEPHERLVDIIEKQKTRK